MKNKFPKVSIDKVSLDENYFENKDGFVYGAAKLIEHSKQYEVFELPLAALDLRRCAWSINDMDDFIHHAKRCSDANLDYPIILDVYGTIADGMHRVVKAIVRGRRTIKAIRLETMPPYDRKVEKEEN